MEKKLDGGAASLEAAYYDYDTDGVFLSEQGKAYSAGAGYIFNEKVGWGKLQPFARYQKFDSDAALNSSTSKYDLGVNYIIEGYNAQVSTVFSETKVSQKDSINALNVALQVQF
jgi:hypothetical protein